jgi:hypothetical protein
MRLIDHQPRMVTPAEVDDLRQIDNVPIHAEDGVDDDQSGAAARGLLQPRFQVLHVVVAKADKIGAGQQTAVDDAGMVELVAEDRVVASDERRNGRQIGGVA